VAIHASYNGFISRKKNQGVGFNLWLKQIGICVVFDLICKNNLEALSIKKCASASLR